MVELATLTTSEAHPEHLKNPRHPSNLPFAQTYPFLPREIERSIQQEIKRRTVKVRVFPNEASLERLVTAILVEIDEKWATTDKPYITWKAEDD